MRIKKRDVLEYRIEVVDREYQSCSSFKCQVYPMDQIIIVDGWAIAMRSVQ